MKTSLALLAGAILLSGCGGAIPRQYQGRFEGGTPAQQVSLDVAPEHVTVKLNENSVELKSFVAGFNDAVTQVESGQGGVFVLPAVESLQGQEITDNPWIPRIDERAAGLEISEQFSDRFSDVYVVIPASTVSEKPNDFYAFVFHTRIDLQQKNEVHAVQADLVPEAEVSAIDTNFMNLVRTKTLSITPLPKYNPDITHVTLERTL